jgi:hypothetical protein
MNQPVIEDKVRRMEKVIAGLGLAQKILRGTRDAIAQHVSDAVSPVFWLAAIAVLFGFVNFVLLLALLAKVN